MHLEVGKESQLAFSRATLGRLHAQIWQKLFLSGLLLIATHGDKLKQIVWDSGGACIYRSVY